MYSVYLCNNFIRNSKCLVKNTIFLHRHHHLSSVFESNESFVSLHLCRAAQILVFHTQLSPPLYQPPQIQYQMSRKLSTSIDQYHWMHFPHARIYLYTHFPARRHSAQLLSITGENIISYCYLLCEITQLWHKAEIGRG